MKFDAEGRVALVLGRKPETIGVRPRSGGAPRTQRGRRRRTRRRRKRAAVDLLRRAPRRLRAGAAPRCAGGTGRCARCGRGAAQPGAGTPGSTFSRPTDVAWDRAGNIYVADGIGTNNRVAKFDKDGQFIKHWGSTGSEHGQFNGVKGLAIDAQGNVYVADTGNKRIQVFDGDGTFKSQFGNVGTPLAMCMTRGATQYLYVSHSGDPDGMDDATIYKVELDGKVRRQVRLGRQAAEAVRPRQLDRLPQRERAARRRDDQLARAEGHAQGRTLALSPRLLEPAGSRRLCSFSPRSTFYSLHEYPRCS